MDVRVRVNLHGGPLPCACWGCGPRLCRTRAHGLRPASPPLHDGPFPCAGWGTGPLPATLGRAYPQSPARPFSPPKNGRGVGIFPPLPKTGGEEASLLLLKMGGEECFHFRRHTLCQNIQCGAALSGWHAKRTVAGPLSAARAQDPHTGGAGPWLGGRLYPGAYVLSHRDGPWA